MSAVRLSRKLGKAIAGRVAVGMPLLYAAQAEGVAKNTVHEWIRRGRGEDDRPATELLSWFAGEMEKARAESIQRAVQAVYEDPSWQARAWWLERRLPDEFGRRERMEHTGEVEHRVTVELAFDPAPAQARRRLARPADVIDLDPALLEETVDAKDKEGS